MVVVDDFDERLDFAAFRLTRFGHSSCDLKGIPFDAGDERVRKGVLFAAVVLWLDNDDLFAGVTTAGDNGLRG